VAIGIDEVGRGALAGPLVVGGCAGPEEPVERLLNSGDVFRDSKALSPAARVLMADRLQALGVRFHVAVIEACEVDSLGLTESLARASRSIVDHFGIQPVFLDGKHDYIGSGLVTTIVKGDVKHPLIAAASIVAKVFRDRLMYDLDEHFPWWGFARNKGYASSQHLFALSAWGPSVVHRMSFAPVNRVLAERKTKNRSFDY
jgi:ribonuclease HII